MVTVATRGVSHISGRYGDNSLNTKPANVTGAGFVAPVYFRRRSQISAATEPTTARAARPPTAPISGVANVVWAWAVPAVTIANANIAIFFIIKFPYLWRENPQPLLPLEAGFSC